MHELALELRLRLFCLLAASMARLVSSPSMRLLIFFLAILASLMKFSPLVYVFSASLNYTCFFLRSSTSPLILLMPSLMVIHTYVPLHLTCVIHGDDLRFNFRKDFFLFCVKGFYPGPIFLCRFQVIRCSIDERSHK